MFEGGSVAVSSLRDEIDKLAASKKMTNKECGALLDVVMLLDEISGIPGDRLREIAAAEREGRLVVLPKESHQPMFVKSDALSIFDEWNDVSGAIEKGTSWYYEAQAVVEEVAAMAFGAGIFYEAERHAEAEAALAGKGEQR